MNKEKSLPSEIFYSLFSLVKPRKAQNANSEWKSHLLPHSPIQELAPNLWHVTGILPASGHPPREMILYKLPDSTKNAYRQWLESLADNITDLQVISVAHGEPIVTNCTQKLHEAATRLNTHK